MINKHANQTFFLLLDVNDYQFSSLQVVGDHSAINSYGTSIISICMYFFLNEKKGMIFICWFKTACLKPANPASVIQWFVSLRFKGVLF